MLLARGGCSPTLGWVGLHISKMLKTRRRCSHKMHSRLMIIFSVDARCAKLPGRVDGAKRSLESYITSAFSTCQRGDDRALQM